MRDYIILTILIFTLQHSIAAQVDTTLTTLDSTENRINLHQLEQQKLNLNNSETSRSWVRKNPYKAMVAPTVLIGVGAGLIKNPIYDRFDFKKDLTRTFKNFG